MWALQKLRQLMTSHFGANINVTALLSSPTGEGTDSDARKTFPVSCTISVVLAFNLASYLFNAVNEK